MKIITGNTGMKHVTSDDDGAMYASIIGKQDYIFDLNDNFSHEILDTNTIKINSGDALLNGRHVRIPRGSYDLVTIDNGQTGYKRIDLITIRYESNGEIERAYLNVIKGTQTTGTATVPSYEKESILNGTLMHDLPLYEVHLNGINLDTVKVVFIAKDLSTTHLGYRPNLLINSDFRNPINQRGKTTYTGTSSKRIYVIDRWTIWGVLDTTVNNGFITLKNNSTTASVSIAQLLETPLTYGDVYTLSAKINGQIVTLTFLGGTASENQYIGYNPANSNLPDRVNLSVPKNTSYSVEWVKLEQGSIATPFVPRPYAEELAVCQRYYQSLVGDTGVNQIIMVTRNRKDEWGNSYFPSLMYLCPMRTAPTISANMKYHSGTEFTGVQYYPTEKQLAFFVVPADYDSAEITKLTLDAEIY